MDDEMVLLYKDGIVVAVEGDSLWTTIRICSGQLRESGALQANPVSFAYKKWQFSQRAISDVVSCGTSFKIEIVTSMMISQPFPSFCRT
jgi:hypothetical protein